MTKTPTMAELRVECAKLGITPARSIAETMARIEARRASDAKIANGAAELLARFRRSLAQPPRMSRLMRHMADSTSLSTGILRAHPIVYQGDVAHQREGAAFVVAQIRTAARGVARAAMAGRR